jgi:hypothetical protein
VTDGFPSQSFSAEAMGVGFNHSCRIYRLAIYVISERVVLGKTTSSAKETSSKSNAGTYPQGYN